MAPAHGGHGRQAGHGRVGVENSAFSGAPSSGALTMIMQAHEVEKRAHVPIKGSPMERAEYLTWVLLCLDFWATITGVASVEASWSGVNYRVTLLANLLRGWLSALSLASAAVICRRYYILEYDGRIYDDEYDEHRPDKRIFAFELLLRLFFIPPGVEFNFAVGGISAYADRYPVANLNTAVFTRLYTIVHYSMLQSIYDDDHVRGSASLSSIFFFPRRRSRRRSSRSRG
jgi:hypothetical protein